MSEHVICKDCKHSFIQLKDWLIHGTASFNYKCRRSYKPEHTEHNPVIGEIKVDAKYETCSVARIGHPDREDRCGELGKFWEPKNKKDLFKFIKHVSV